METVYWNISLGFGLLIGIAVFFGIWASILMIYDTVGGLVFGWLPSVLIAAFAFGLVYISWPLIILSIVSFMFLVLYELRRP